MSFTFKKDKNWVKFRKALEPESAKKVIKKHMDRATRLNGKVFEKHVRESIKNDTFLANAELTEAIKNDNKPLVGVETGATLFKAITSRAIKTGSAMKSAVFVGVLRTNSFYNIALAIHNGKTIKVTDKMRGLFLALFLASQGRIDRSKLSKRGQDLFDYMSTGWKPLKRGTTRIIIPPRRFIDNVFKDPEATKIAQNNWKQALKAAFKEIKATS